MMLYRPELPAVSSATMTQHASQVSVGMKGCVRLPQTTKPQTAKQCYTIPKPQTTKPQTSKAAAIYGTNARCERGNDRELTRRDAAQECSRFQHFGCHGSGSGSWTYLRGVLPHLQRSAWVCEQQLKHTRPGDGNCHTCFLHQGLL